MRYRRETSDGDYSFGQGDNTFLSNSTETVAQAVKTRLSLWRGQWFLDNEEGTPWRQAVLGKHTNDAYGMTIKQQILNTPGVVEITEFNLLQTASSRKITITAQIQTQYGETSFTHEA